MKKLKTIIWILVIIGTMSIASANVPDLYKANYWIASDRENIKKIFVQIEANNDIWEITPSSSFSSLHTSFQNVLNKFPQEYTFQITYEKCRTLSQNLANAYSQSTFASFMNNCFKPLSQILNTIDASYTVKAWAKASPTSWPAPLTVTFDARSSSDPSSETIPNNNYYRYYRDTNWQDQIIWNESVLSYTFDKVWTHIVHLTVRSSNNNNGVFDGEKDIAIEVKPKIAVISVYANSKKLDTNEKIKFWIQEWTNWIIFDGSATVPVWWSEIKSHTRKVTWWDGFNRSKKIEWNPWAIKLTLNNEWEYKITLQAEDNQWNMIAETYSVILSDPVAIIKQTPTEWSTSNTFTFDASSSYSIQSKINLYTREIFDSNWTKMSTYQWKTIKYQFKEPWSYTVKLTVNDELWQTNTQSTLVYVESSTPIAQFNMKPISDWKYPSKYQLDASLSSDIDLENNVDELSYSWYFSNANTTTIEDIEWNNKKVIASFNSVWEQNIKLIVTDKYWKVSEIEKPIKIDSTLRPEVIILPKATTRWTPINFIVKSNEEILSYSRDFWDWTTLTELSNKVVHKYNSVWTYKITLTVHWKNWMENTITENVFIWEEDSPVIWYKVKNKNNEIIRENEECTDWAGTHPAHKITRYDDITIDPSDSVNTKWQKSDLKFTFRPKNWELYNSSTFKHNFDELWCTYIDMTIEDSAFWINTWQRIWFKVYNSLPKFDNITISFPQYGNESWIWFNQNYVQDIFNSDNQTLIVKVTATNPKDPDWYISHFKRYYYYKSDPTRRLETKITPGDINYTYFSLPNIAWEYMFWVTIYDNDEWKVISEEEIWNWPIILLPPDTTNIDFPMVTLKTNKNNIEVWDEVTFSVFSKIISDRSDFTRERTILYDFDWDGNRDLTTKEDEVTYTYKEANTNGYVPRAAVTYRWNKWTANGESIIVKEWLKPRLLYTNVWKLVLFRDISLGKIASSETCLSFIDCNKWIEWFLINSQKTPNYVFEYPDFGKYFVSLNLWDEYAHQVNKKFAITLTGIKADNWNEINYTWNIKLLSIPEYTENENNTYEIFVWNNLDNSILFYVDTKNKDMECYVDTDITDDIEKDFDCNTVYLYKYTPSFTDKVWKIVYKVWEETKIQEFNVSFLDYWITLDEKTNSIYNKISEIMKSIKDENLKVLLLNTQSSITDEVATQANVVALQEYLRKEKTDITDDQRNSIQEIIDWLSDSTVIWALWWTEYEIARAEILGILPISIRNKVSQKFTEFETIEWNSSDWLSQNDKRKEKLNEIIQLIDWIIATNDASQTENEISKADMEDIILPNMCKITSYYWIASETCSTVPNTPNTPIIDESSKWLSKWLKILIISLSSLIGIFVILVILFAIKAKINREKEEEW